MIKYLSIKTINLQHHEINKQFGITLSFALDESNKYLRSSEKDITHFLHTRVVPSIFNNCAPAGIIKP